MRPLLTRLTLIAAASLLAASVSAGTNDVLFRSGVVAPDGRALSFFETPRAGRATRGVFTGLTSAVMTKSGATFAVIARTGDALPGLLPGTFNSFNDPAINDSGAVVFRATVNSTAAEAGLFLYDGATMTTIALAGGTAGGPDAVSRAPDINGANDVVYETDDTTLLLWDGSGSTPIVSAGDASPGGGTFTHFGDRPVINASRVVAFEAEVSGGPEGVFTWDPVNGVRAVALEDGPAPGLPAATFRAFSKGIPISINAAGQVVFVTDTQPSIVTVVVRYDPSGPSLTRIAREGDAVGGETITTMQKRYVGINASGVVAFDAFLSSTAWNVVQSVGGVLSSLSIVGNVNEYAPRLTSARHLTWRGSGTSIQRFDGAIANVLTKADATPLGSGVLGHEPSINDSDVVAFRVSQAVLYSYDDGTLTVLMTPGDPSPDGSGLVLIVGTPVLRRTSLVVNLLLVGGAQTLALKRGEAPFVGIVNSAGTTPVGGTFDLFDDIYDVNGQTVVFESTISGASAGSGLFRIKASTAAVTTIATDEDTAPNGAFFNDFTNVVMAGKEAVFQADLSDSNTGLFVTSHGEIVPIALTGDAAPGTAGTFSSFTNIAARGSHVAFSASTTAGDGIFAYHRGTLTKVALEGDPEPGGGTFSFIDGSTPLAAGSKGPVFAADPSIGATEGLYAASGSTIIARALSGDAVSGGGAITSVELGEPLSLVGRSIVYEAALDAASGASWGLINNTP